MTHPIQLQQFRAGGGNTNAATGIPTDELRDLLDTRMKEIGKETAIATCQSEHAGAHELVAARAAAKLGQRPESVYRRIAGILAGESEVTDLTIADAILLACDINLGLTNLPVLPGSRTGAERLVDAYRASHPMTGAQYEELVHKLTRFCLGYSNGPLVMEEPDAIARAEHRATIASKRKARKAVAA